MQNPLLPYPATVIDIQDEARDTVTFTLAFRDEQIQSRYHFEPGQFNMIGVFGLGEVPISMSSNPSERNFFQHTFKAVGNVTRVLGRLGVGDTVGIRGPYGTFWPLKAAGGKDILIIGGGIGFAPLRPVIEHIAGNRTVYGNVTILYGAKTPGDVGFRRDFDKWTVYRSMRLLLTVDRTDDEPWEHEVGVVPTLIDKINLDPKNTFVMICGPEIMMRFCLIDLLKRGMPMENIYISMERRMSCGVAQCGHCFFGPKFVCRDGPVFPLPDIYDLLGKGV